MGIIATGSPAGTYEPAPAGTYSAVCVDVVDEGMKETPNGPKHKVSVWWQIDEELPTKPGQRFTVRKWYTLSLNEKATLYADLVSWRGKAFTEEELQGFDLEKLLGVPCLLGVIHAKSADGSRTYANVASVAKLARGMVALTPDGYVRRQDRDPRALVDDGLSAQERAAHLAAVSPDADALDDIPF